MNENNLEYLKKGLLYGGFGEKLYEALEAKIKEQPKDFQLATQQEYKRGESMEKVDYMLEFRKSDTTDMYFFNRYQANLKNEDPTKEKSHTFYINKDFQITAKEAFNLLSGRAVNKDMVTKDQKPYNAWLQLDFSKKDERQNFEVKQFTSGYGYDLDATLSRYPIKEIVTNEDRVKLMGALQKGNLQPVTFAREGGEQRMYIEANPQFKTINLYDSKLQKVFQANEKKASNGDEKSVEKKEKLARDEDGPGEQSTKSKKKGVKI